MSLETQLSLSVWSPSWSFSKYLFHLGRCCYKADYNYIYVVVATRKTQYLETLKLGMTQLTCFKMRAVAKWESLVKQNITSPNIIKESESKDVLVNCIIPPRWE